MKIIRIHKTAYGDQTSLLQVDPTKEADENVQAQNAKLALDAINRLVVQVQIPEQLTGEYTKQIEASMNAMSTQNGFINLYQSLNAPITQLITEFNNQITTQIDQKIEGSNDFRMIQNYGVPLTVEDLKDPNTVGIQVDIITKKIALGFQNASENASVI